MSSNYTSGSGSGAAHNSSSFVSRREIRASNATGALPPLGSVIGPERSYTGSFDFEQMLQSLHDLFEKDRQIASQTDATRCGICYLYYPLSQLHYREEGLYMCEQCEQALGHQSMPVVRKQQKL